ncbi:MAG: LEA type 2 family protein [Gemmatimonadales bacterium]|nr:MAG: LEA type 2 family protein [Gemmatimonadales bacterium]
MTTIKRLARSAVTLAVCSGVTLLAGCASLVREPQVSLTRVGLASIGISGATARVELDVHNPNGFGLDARSVEYTLAFHPSDPEELPSVPESEWRTLATGRSADAVSLTAKTTTPVTVLVPFSYAELGAAASSLLQRGRLRYRFSGAFTVGSPIGDLRIPFDRDGILDP